MIVNNDPDCSDGETIRGRFPAVRWIEMGYNAGFARANNRGILASSGDCVLLLNPDTLLSEDAISACYHRLRRSDFVAAAVQLRNEDGSPQITGNFFMKGGLNHLLPLPYLGPLLRRIAFAVGAKKTNVAAPSAEEKVDWINGAFLMVKRSAIQDAGLMDEDFFLYSEETEWCYRLGLVGSLCVYGDLSITHLQGESVGKIIDQQGKGYQQISGKKGLQLMVSQHVRIRKQFGKGWFLCHLLIFTLEIPILFFVSFVHNLFRLRNPLADWKIGASYARNVFILWRLSPRIWRNEPYFYKTF